MNKRIEHFTTNFASLLWSLDYVHSLHHFQVAVVVFAGNFRAKTSLKIDCFILSVNYHLLIDLLKITLPLTYRNIYEKMDKNVVYKQWLASLK